ncbi:MAG: helix-turn-helix domain-containing protein [Peptoniphilus senegalensis]
MSNRISELRQRNKLTQKELADKLNINYSVLSRIETGERSIRDDELMEIADFFNVTTDYLLGRSSNPKLSRKNELDIHRDLEAMKENFNKGALQMQLDGEELDDEVIQYILDNLEDALTIAKIRSKEKFTPKKYK